VESTSTEKRERIGPSVSIITPAYNAERYLAETVDSVLGQSFADFELLVVDDGSTDGTATLASGLARQDRRIRFIATPNRGPAAARNTALRASRGEFLALLDSDDTWESDYLAKQLAIFRICADAAIVTANAINRGGPWSGRPFWPRTTGVRRVTFRDVIEHEDSVCIMTVFRRKVYSAIGGFDPTFTGNEDYEFWLRAARAGFVILQHFTPLGYYRRHDGSLSRDEPQMIRGILRVLRSAESLCDQRPDDLEAIRRQVQRFDRELPRVELRAALQRRDVDAATRMMQTLSAERGGWVLPALAWLSARWSQPLLWAYRLRCALRA
jgi:glycosyltransferase involved in cell wall biosynthesis